MLQKNQEQQQAQEYSPEQQYVPEHLDLQAGPCLDVLGSRDRDIAQETIKEQSKARASSEDRNNEFYQVRQN